MHMMVTKTSSFFFKSSALEIGLTELKSHYGIPDRQIIELIVKFNVMRHLAAVWNMALEVPSVTG
jgi:hypothetical protein